MRRSIARRGFALWLAGGLATLPTAGVDGRGVGVTLENELGSDQEIERVTVYLDDVRVGELVVDRKRPRAQLSLAISRPSHRYRLEGEARLGGVTYRIAGGGLIVDTARMDGIAERPSTAVEAVAAYRGLVAELVAAAPGADLDSVLFVPGAKAEQGAVAAAEKRLGVPLPSGYRRLVEDVGAFRLGAGTHTAGAVLGPHELATAVDFYVATVRDNGWDDENELRELATRIGNHETRRISFYRARTDDEGRRIWMRLTELDADDGED